MPRLVRRRTLRDRLLSYLNPLDLALDIYTCIESYDWDGVQSTTSTPIGLTLNILLFIARVNCSRTSPSAYNDVLLTQPQKHGWDTGSQLGYSLRYCSWVLAGVSILNSLLCFTKKKRYRMFESNIEVKPSTPNARRVPVESSPSENGIIEFLSPSKSRHSEYASASDVWEISVWDPTPLSLKLFSLFSPVHCAVYFLIFPITPANSYLFPAFAGGTTMYFIIATIQAVLSLQLGRLISAFAQQAIDKTLIHKEVLHEYDNKYVHPRLSVLKRDVATQTKDDHFEASVDTYTPEFNRRGFVIHPNPQYQHCITDSYSSTSGFGTPPVERQLRREQRQHTGRPSGWLKQEEEEIETPIKSEWATRPRHGGRSTGNLLGADGARERERAKAQQEQQERTKRGSSAFATIYPDIDEEDFDYPRKPLSRVNNLASNTPILAPKRSQGQAFLSPTRDHDYDYDHDRGVVGRTLDTPIRDLGSPRRPTFIPATGGNNIGINGLINLARENSKSLSPSKLGSPTRTRARTSSYGASVFGTPKK